MTNSDYKDLAPNDAIENGDEYLYSLNWALQDPKIKNIALTGPYGSGKSSIIDTFLKQNDSKSLYAQINDRFHGRNVPSSKNSLKISMATFSSGLKDSNSLSTSKVKLNILAFLRVGIASCILLTVVEYSFSNSFFYFFSFYFALFLNMIFYLASIKILLMQGAGYI